LFFDFVHIDECIVLKNVFYILLRLVVEKNASTLWKFLSRKKWIYFVLKRGKMIIIFQNIEKKNKEINGNCFLTCFWGCTYKIARD